MITCGTTKPVKTNTHASRGTAASTTKAARLITLRFMSWSTWNLSDVPPSAVEAGERLGTSPSHGKEQVPDEIIHGRAGPAGRGRPSGQAPQTER